MAFIVKTGHVIRVIGESTADFVVFNANDLKERFDQARTKVVQGKIFVSAGDAGVALVLGIHRFMSEAISVTNLIGNGVATIAVGRWCGEVDEQRLRECLGPRTSHRTDEPRIIFDEETAQLATPVDEDRV